MKNMIQVIVETISEYPEAVHINETENDETCIYTVHVDKRDLGKMIGKKGKTASCIRNLVFASSFKTKKRYTIDFISP